MAKLLRRVSLLSLLIWQSPAVAQIMLHDFWVRQMPPGASVNAAYGLIMNHGAQPVMITDVTSVAADRATLHETLQEDDRVRMKAVGQVTIEPGQTLALAPGGMHVMLMGLDTSRSVDGVLPICFLSKDSTGHTDSVCTEAVTKAMVSPNGAVHSEQHQHH